MDELQHTTAADDNAAADQIFITRQRTSTARNGGRGASARPLRRVEAIDRGHRKRLRHTLVVRFGSLSRAAERVGLSKSSLSDILSFKCVPRVFNAVAIFQAVGWRVTSGALEATFPGIVQAQLGRRRQHAN